MADVYTGGIPDHGFQTNLGKSSEGEIKTTPGDADAPDPKTVGGAGSGGGKTYDKAKSQDFLLDDSYQAGGMSVGRVSGGGATRNPDDISNADHC